MDKLKLLFIKLFKIFKMPLIALVVFELWLQLFAIPLFGAIDGKTGFDFWSQLSIGHWLFHIY